MKNIDQIKIEIGSRVKESRIRKGLNQEDLAKMIGIEKTAISRKERGENFFNPFEIIQVSEALGENIEFLITGKNIEVNEISSSQHEKEIELIQAYRILPDSSKNTILRTVLSEMNNHNKNKNA